MAIETEETVRVSKEYLKSLAWVSPPERPDLFYATDRDWLYERLRDLVTHEIGYFAAPVRHLKVDPAKQIVYLPDDYWVKVVH